MERLDAIAVSWELAIGLFVAVWGAVQVATAVVLRLLERHAVLDHPNARSSHDTPTPRGGGLAVMVVVIPVWAWIGLARAEDGVEVLAVAGAALGLAALSWLDDLRGGLPVLVRLVGQALAVTAALSVMDGGGSILDDRLPPAVAVVLAGVLWMWFVNLYNFMDGIDGIAGMETATIGLGAALVAAIAGLGAPPILLGLTVAAGALGFLRWNWHPAKIFLGDVGSVPLGFLLGWLLLALAREGQGAAATILPLYYLADASFTLAMRGARGEKVWRAHREHSYQRAVQRGLSHAKVVLTILPVNVALVGLAALAALGWPRGALAVATIIVAVLLAFLRGGRRGWAFGEASAP